RWRSPVGTGKPFTGAPPVILEIAEAVPELAASPNRLGWPNRSFVLVTKTLLLVVQQGYQDNGRRAPVSRRMIWDLNDLEPRLFAYEKGRRPLPGGVPLPANAGGAPMTYMAGGK